MKTNAETDPRRVWTQNEQDSSVPPNEAFHSEVLQPQQLAMTLLGGYVRNRRQTIWSGGFVGLLVDAGFTVGAARAALSRMVQNGMLDRVRSGRLIHYRPTDALERILDEGDRRMEWIESPIAPADTWTLLWHDIPLAKRLERTRLARRLRFLGFGPVQDGLWISQHDREAELEQLFDEFEVREHASVLIGRIAELPGLSAIIRRAWDLDALCQRYRAFTKHYRAVADSCETMSDREAFVARTMLVHDYRLLECPDLPSAMMPDPGARPEAVDTYFVISQSLATRAFRYFDSMMSAGKPFSNAVDVAEHAR